MLTLPPSVRIYLATQSVDLRNGIDGLCALVRRWGGDPFDGHLYVFLSRRRDRVKVLTWTSGGFAVWYKRLEAGRFRRPLAAADGSTARLDAAQLAMLLDGIDVNGVKRAKLWEPGRAA
jgi:transposase